LNPEKNKMQIVENNELINNLRIGLETRGKDIEKTNWEDELGKWKPATAVVDNQTLELTSQYFQENTYVTRGNLGETLLIFKWNKEGRQLSEAITTQLLNQPLGIFEGTQPLLGEDGRPIAPTVRAVITDSGHIILAALAPLSPEEIRGKRIAVPGMMTTAYLALRLFEPDSRPLRRRSTRFSKLWHPDR
jgi:hypothetical protein